MRGFALLCLCLLGCYRPEAVPACAISCNANAECPEGNVCGSDRRCSPTGSAECKDITPPPDGACASPYGLGLLRVCPTSMPRTSYRPALDQMLDTSIDATCDFMLAQQGTNAPDLCVIAATTIRLERGTRVAGDRPLLLLATENLTLTSGAVIRTIGSAGPKFCPATNGGATQTTQTSRGAGGGAGGSFVGMGGYGGAGDNTMFASPQPGEDVVFVRGGCPGGSGGNSNITSNRAAPGNGGGAVYLLAGQTMVIEGFIDAGGQGGQGGPATNAGGAGGGAGGMIVLDAPSLITGPTMHLLATGGGGGGGSAGGTGDGGEDPTLGMPTGSGGKSEAVNNGAGGDGSGLGANGVTGSTANIGGSGGGGGGAGLIRFYSNSATPGSPNIHPPL